MSRTTWPLAATALAAALTASACGGGDSAGVDAWTLPRQWKKGDAFGFARLDVQTTNPQTLNESGRSCRFAAQLASATADGTLPRADEQGACVVDQPRSYAAAGSELSPACAGVVVLEVGGTTRRITACGDSFGPGIEVDCDTAAGAPDFVVSSGADDVDGEDRLTSLEQVVPRPTPPEVVTPKLTGIGSAVWPEGELRIAWTPSAGEGIEITVRKRDSAGPVVRCMYADEAGEATLPSRLLEPYRDATTVVEVARLVQRRPEADGFTLRTTARTSDAFWLFPR